jgi:L-arabinose isomerase
MHLLRRIKHVTEEELEAEKQRILEFFDTPDPVSDPISQKLKDSNLEVAARVSVALQKFVRERQLDGLAYYYEGEANSLTSQVMANLAVGNSLLTGSGFSMCGESDLKTCIAMFIMDRLGIGGSFAEFHPVDFKENFILVGHDGPHNVTIAEGKPVLRSLKKYHGKPGFGAGVEFKIKEGPVTSGRTHSSHRKYEHALLL